MQKMGLNDVARTLRAANRDLNRTPGKSQSPMKKLTFSAAKDPTSG